MTITTRSDFKTTTWQGGTTTELYISPIGASYSERNFDFRLSSAKVETPTSTFTPLPGINRKLMVLEGEIAINHENHHSKILKKFDVDTFSGNWNTSAVGTCTDFNLMTKSNFISELTHIQLLANHYKKIDIEEQFQTLCIYVHSGSINAEIDNKLYNLKKESVLILSNINIFSFHLQGQKHSDIIISKIGK